MKCVHLGPVHPSLWLMDFVQIFREVPEYVQWFTLGVSNFYVKRKQNKNHLYPHTATLDFCIAYRLYILKFLSDLFGIDEKY